MSAGPKPRRDSLTRTPNTAMLLSVLQAAIANRPTPGAALWVTATPMSNRRLTLMRVTPPINLKVTLAMNPLIRGLSRARCSRQSMSGTARWGPWRITPRTAEKPG